MPYPLPDPPATAGAARVRLLPPIGCPGLEQWVLPLELAGWTELGYRQGPVPAAALELFWLPADPRWDEPQQAAAITLVINPLQRPAEHVTIDWGDGSSETLPWPALSRKLPPPRHLYPSRLDCTVQVQLGGQSAELPVHLLRCPQTPSRRQTRMVQRLIPGDGLMADPDDGGAALTWRLRLHPNGGLRFVTQAGHKALAIDPNSRFHRASRWYAGDGPPPTGTAATPLQPQPAVGDFYLDRLSGQLYELSP